MFAENWICDKCNEPIKTPSDGWFEWLRTIESEVLSDFQIVHYRTCLRDEKFFQKEGFAVPGFPLQLFLDDDGLIRLLELLSNTDLKNQKKLIEIIQRLQVPGYEFARFHFEHACLEGYIDSPKQGVYYPEEEQIKEINKGYGQTSGE